MNRMATNEPVDEPLSSTTDSNVGRRSFLQTAGAAAALAAMGTAEASTQSPATDPTAMMTEGSSGNETSYGSFKVGPKKLVIGGRLIVGTDGFDTIEEAWKKADSGDTVYVHSSYDAKSAGEEFPIRLDCRDKEVMLTGGHPSGSVIDASHTDQNVIELVGAGHSDYRNNPVVQNLKIVGGNVGLKIFGAPFSSYKDLVFYRTGSHAVEVCKYDVDGTTYGTFGTSFTNCQAWGCGGNGFHLNGDASPHGTSFAYCKATACGGHGYRLRGTLVKLVGCDTQLNYGWGVVARGGYNTLLTGVYVEGNARGAQNDSAPSEIYVRGTDGFTVENCYFHGIYPRGAEHDFDRVQRGMTIHETDRVTVRNCTVRRYGSGFVAFYDCMDADIHRSSHVIRETQLFGGGTGDRTRSAGVILPQDLSAVDGTFEGDRGYHVGSDREGFAVWRNGTWYLAETTTL